MYLGEEYTATVMTKTLFRHSADEKAAYLRDFLRAINVNRIDLLVSHSSAVFPSLLILLNDSHNYEYLDSSGKAVQTSPHNNTTTYNKNKKNKNSNNTAGAKGQQVIEGSRYHIEIRALALFNPAGHRLPQSMKPTWFKCGSVRIYQNKLGRSIFQKFGSGFLTIVGVPVRVDNMDHVMLSATVMRNSECQRVVQQLNYLNQLKLPTLLVFSENDKLIEKDIFYEMTRFMGLNRNHFDIFNHQGEIERARKLPLTTDCASHLACAPVTLLTIIAPLSILSTYQPVVRMPACLNPSSGSVQNPPKRIGSASWCSRRAVIMPTPTMPVR